MKPLIIDQFPLRGTSLIEASAGTGKTYTIVNLYLRILLGHRCEPLDVEHILVVTFTNAATAELKERIRSRIQQAYLDFFRGSSSDGFTQKLIQDSQDTTKDCQRLALAIKQMDDAAVFTIHSFCQRMLSEHAFESGVNFDEQFEMDESQWLQMAAQDYWRNHITPLNIELLQQITQHWSSPEALLSDVRPFLNRQWKSQQPITVEQAFEQFNAYKDKLSQVKHWWIEQHVAEKFRQAKLKGNTRLGRQRVIDTMSTFCQSTQSFCPFDKEGFSDWTNEKLNKARSKQSPDTIELDLTAIEELESLHNKMQSWLQQAFLEDAVAAIKQNMQFHKTRLNLLSPDDLLTRLSTALQGKNGHLLRQVAQGSYPFALIDEFQDTDPVQFDIFSQIYPTTQADSEIGLIMIGDPKQAIYGFRGADIFTYIKAKRLVDADRQYTLDTNWRSSESLVEALNCLFASSASGFLFANDIPFYPVKAAKPSSQLYVDEQPLYPLNFIHLQNSGAPLSDSIAMPQLADAFAGHIANLLQRAHIQRGAEKQILKVHAGDCCVLVRNRQEASFIKQALSAVNVASVFLVRKSVFETNTARDLYRLLIAVSEPQNERSLKAALATELLCLDATTLDNLFTDEVRWQNTVEQFYLWQKSWQEKGIMLTVNQMMQYFSVYQKLLANFEDGLRRLTDLRHLTELLQQQASVTPAENQMLYWFSGHLNDPDHNNEAQQLRLETDDNLVQIITMHASKGLEFPFVFIPFALSSKPARNPIYNQPETGSIADFSKQEFTLQQADFERLAEDIRLLYVALTRAKFYCAVGLWEPSLGRSKQSNLYNTALGRVLFDDESNASDSALEQAVLTISQDAQIGYCSVDQLPPTTVLQQDKQVDDADWVVAKLAKPIKRNWQLTSYSAIAREQQHPEWERPGLDEQESRVEDTSAELNVLSRFNFTKGAQAGSFLHGVLEKVTFDQPHDLAQIIEQQGKWFGIEPQWNDVVFDWITEILVTPFGHNEQLQGLCLSTLKAEQVRVEMEFHMPLRQVNVEQFNQIINQHFPTIARQYGFTMLNGMLKGFIDLTFEYHGRYYVADYKSNYLGERFENYSQQAMGMAMDEHDYQLQSVLYILALHRFLRTRLKNYQYEQHIGGAYYLFLRGMHKQHAGNGCYFSRPEKTLIDALDGLFDNQPMPPKSTDMEQLSLC